MNCDISLEEEYSYRQIIDMFIKCDNIYKIWFYKNRVIICWFEVTSKSKTITGIPVKRSKKSVCYNYKLTFDKGGW